MQLPNIIEKSGQRVLTTAQITEAYGTTDKIIRRNFERNKEHYQEGKHYYCLTGKELQKFVSDNLTLSNRARKIHLWTERGALLHAKSLNTDKAWEVYDFLIENYFRPDYSELSPQLQFMIQMEQKQNQLEQRQSDLESRVNAKLEEDREELIKNVIARRIRKKNRDRILKEWGRLYV